MTITDTVDVAQLLVQAIGKRESGVSYEHDLMIVGKKLEELGDSTLAACCYRILGKDELVEIALKEDVKKGASIIISFLLNDLVMCQDLCETKQDLCSGYEKEFLDAIQMTCLLCNKYGNNFLSKDDVVEKMQGVIMCLVHGTNTRTYVLACLVKEIMLIYLEGAS